MEGEGAVKEILVDSCSQPGGGPEQQGQARPGREQAAVTPKLEKAPPEKGVGGKANRSGRPVDLSGLLGSGKSFSFILSVMGRFWARRKMV